LAIYHLSMKPISRSSGRSSVAAAAYRAGVRLTNDRDGLTHDFTRRAGVEHAEIVVPKGSGAEWALDRSALWNAAEASESRKDARCAREFEIALPHELSAEQRLALTRDFAQSLADRHGTAVDFAIHAPHFSSDARSQGDERNFHAHLMMTTRSLTAEGLGDKTALERENKWLAARDLPLTQVQLTDIRRSWEQVANEHLARAGFEVQIDHRSHLKRGLEIEPTEHMGVQATQMQRRGQSVSRSRLDAEASRRNAALIRERPEEVLSIITGEKSVFDHRDVARALHRAIDGAAEFSDSFGKVMASPALVELSHEQRDGQGRIVQPARYSTREMIAIEREMAAASARLAGAREHGVGAERVAAALAARPHLAAEQRAAVLHVTGAEGMAVVVGLAGSGKSTMLSAAREAWEAAGHRVHGAALSGKAAEGLEESSGIDSRTLASWENGWNSGRGLLEKGDVFVIDEAGMVSSKQLARFIGAAERAGAKIVLVGDPEQLQPIQAGAAFRAVAERVGYAALEGVRRQNEAWQREASVAFAQHRTAEGLASYAAHGGISFGETRDEVFSTIVREATADIRARPEGSRLVLAHRRADVFELNEAIREARQEAGELARGFEAGEVAFATQGGERRFAAGDRVIFLENNRDLGVKNGMLGTVARVSEGRLVAHLDSFDGPGQGREVDVSIADYGAVDHGYATTIHKSQGATVDRSFVLASDRMDRHLTYVALSRHRDGATLYGSREEFSGFAELSARLSRSGAKETTLDYAERRGIAASLGIESEIVVAGPVDQQAERQAGRQADRQADQVGSGLAERDNAREAPDVARETGLVAAAGPASTPVDLTVDPLELARAILAREDRPSAQHDGRERRPEASAASPPLAAAAGGPADAGAQQAIAAAKEAYQTARAVAEARAAYEAYERSRQEALEAERQRALEEAQRRVEQEAQRLAREEEAVRQRGPSLGM